MNEAIKLAIEKGGFEVGELTRTEALAGNVQVKAVIVKSPLFWQALGKALGWDEKTPEYMHNIWPDEEWKLNWHRYIDALAEGKEDEFWKKLSTINQENPGANI